MARPIKHTVDYFSHDADASEGKTLTILENNFGLEGYAAWFKLLERLSKAENHVMKCRNSEDIEFLAAKLRLQPDKTRLILQKMADLGAIDSDLYSKGFIWSQNFVARLKDVYDNRKQDLPQKPVIDVTTLNNAIINPNIPLETPLPSVESTQSKVKDSKEKKNSKKENTPATDKKSYGSLLNVLLTDEEVTKGKAKFTDWEYRLESFSLKKAAKGYKYVDDYAAICTWARDDEKKGVGKSSGQNHGRAPVGSPTIAPGWKRYWPV